MSGAGLFEQLVADAIRDFLALPDAETKAVAARFEHGHALSRLAATHEHGRSYKPDRALYELTAGLRKSVPERVWAITLHAALEANELDAIGDILQHKACPELLHVWAAGHPSDEVREIVAETARVPHVLAQLARDPLDYIRTEVARDPRLPADAVEMLAADPNWLVREVVARRRWLPDALRRRLAGDPHPDVALAARQAATG